MFLQTANVGARETKTPRNYAPPLIASTSLGLPLSAWHGRAPPPAPGAKWISGLRQRLRG